MKYNFDREIDRHGSGCMKIDDLTALFGRADLTPLWIADMDFPVCQEITNALQHRISHPIYGYSRPDEGYWESILHWLKSRHDFDVDRQEITFIPGVVKGIAYAVNFFTNQGDGIVIQPPVYHPFRVVIEGNGRIAIPNPLIATDDGDGYRMDLEGLERIFAESKPKMMILCNPHNPIGIQWDSQTLAKVGELAHRYGVVVVSDEIHGDLMLGGRRHIPFVDCSESCAKVGIMLGAPSKTFNIPGLVSSWCVVKNPQLREPFFHWLEVNEFNAPTFVSTIGAEAAYNNGGEWLRQALDYIEDNIAFTREYLQTHMPEIKMVTPQASFLIWMDFRSLNLSHDELVDLVVNHAGLALNDGEMFGSEGHGFMRVNVATPRCCLHKALESLRMALSEA